MAYQVLARKYRSKNFDQVIGQDHVVRSLRNAVQKSLIGNAYIFSGTRGVGKTSVARLFAKAIRCLAPQDDGNPCDKCESCEDFNSGSSINILEIDGASNNGVENIRDLISEVQYLPSVGKYKVYIIDEVHMVTQAAFNALLKTLEEPPEHVVFILATTEPEKLLSTVHSRCQRFDFRHVSEDVLVGHLKNLCQKENIQYQDDSILQKIAEQGRGSVRDTLSLLDQVLSYAIDCKIDESILTRSLGLAGSASILKIINDIVLENDQEVLKTFYSLLSENVSVKNIVKSVLNELYESISDFKNNTFESKDLSLAEMIWIYESIAKETDWALKSMMPEQSVSILLKKIALRRTFFNVSAKKKPEITESSKEIKKVKSTPVVPKEEILVPSNLEAVEIKEVTPIAEKIEVSAIEEDVPPIKEVHKKSEAPKVKNWETFLEFLLDKSPAIAANLEQGNVLDAIEHNHLGLKIDFAFKSGGKVFYEHLQSKVAFEKLLAFLSEHFEVEVPKIKFNLQLKESDYKEDGFRTKAEIAIDAENERIEEMKTDFSNDPMIKEAEKIFHSKIDKIVVKEN